MSSLASALSRTDADLVALEELWMESDHAMLEEALKESGGFNVTGYRQLATAECEGWIGPLFCSGKLGVATKFDVKKQIKPIPHEGLMMPRFCCERKTLIPTSFYNAYYKQ